jgi:hypothetical protein
LRIDLDMVVANYRIIQNPDALAPFVNLLYLAINGGGENITQLPRIPPSVIFLSCNDNTLIELPELPPGLRQLFCNNNLIEQLPDDLPAGLVSFTCNDNNIEHLPTLPPGLMGLACNSNRITAIPPLPATLMGFACDNNSIETLPAQLPPRLSELSCSNNQIRVIPPLPQGFRMLNCAHNMLTALPALPPGLTSLICSFNSITELPPLPAGLRQLVCNNNRLTDLPQLPRGMTRFEMRNNPFPQETRVLIATELRTGQRPGAIANVQQGQPQAQLRPRPRVRQRPPPNNHPGHIQTPTRAPLLNIETIYDNARAQPLTTATDVLHPAPDTQGFDPIQYMSQPVYEFIAEDPAANFAVVIQGNWYLLNANDVLTHQAQNPNLIRYQCYRATYELAPNPNNINITTPYITLRGLGIPAGGVIPLAQLKHVLNNNRTPPYFTIIDTNTTLVTTISAQMFGPDANAVSAAHCQEGQGQPVYELQQLAQQQPLGRLAGGASLKGAHPARQGGRPRQRIQRRRHRTTRRRKKLTLRRTKQRNT